MSIISKEILRNYINELNVICFIKNKDDYIAYCLVSLYNDRVR